MRCDLVHIEQVPIGESALRLFVMEDELCAGVIEHRPDGRLVTFESPRAGVDGIIPVIRLLLSRQQEHLYVVIEKGAYWPETFPKLHTSSR